MYKVKLDTKERTQFINITSKVQHIVTEVGVEQGIAHIFVPHTTAALTINENADPDVVRDIIVNLNKVFPLKGDYLHIEGNSDAHIKSSLMGSSEVIFINNGRLLMGIWQGLFFCEFDGPRPREVWVKISKC